MGRCIHGFQRPARTFGATMHLNCCLSLPRTARKNGAQERGAVAAMPPDCHAQHPQLDCFQIGRT